MRFLVTNDDGYYSLGIKIMAKVLRTLGQVTVVAPEKEMSAASHSLTLTGGLTLAEHEEGVFSLNGTPTDCVVCAVKELIPERPDYVVSGINHGANLSDDVTYSGTVAAAIEGTLLGIPSIAVSYASRDPRFLKEWEKPLQEILKQITSREIPEDTLLNLNIPPIPIRESRGVKITTLGKRLYLDAVTSRRGKGGRIHFRIGGQKIRWKGNNSSDFVAIGEGYISITPLHLDLTNYRMLKELNGWRLSFRKEGS